MPETIAQILLLLFQSLVLAAFLLGAEHVRQTLGLAPVYLLVGALQLPQTVLSVTAYIAFSDEFVVSAGPTVLFTSTLFAVLMVHRLEGASRARQLIYGVFLINICMAVLLWSIGLQLDSALSVNLLAVPPALFSESSRVILLGSLILLLDVILVVSLYDGLERARWPAFMQIFVSLGLVLSVDALLFFALNFHSDPNFASRLATAILSKLSVALLFSAALSAYLWRYPKPAAHAGFLATLRYLTFRADINELIKAADHDSTTGAHSRRFLDQLLQRMDKQESRQPWALLMVDLDHFKMVNDRFGHATGDEVLQHCVKEMQGAVRQEDTVSRFGGEEFAIIMPGALMADAARAAERIRVAISSFHKQVPALAEKGPFTASIGVATYPTDGTQSAQIMAVADARLYRAKDAGRDRVIVDDSSNADQAINNPDPT